MFTVKKLFLTLAALSIALLLSSLLGIRWFYAYPEEVESYIQQQQHDLNSITTTLFLEHTNLLHGVDKYANSEFIRELFFHSEQKRAFGININAWQLNAIAVVTDDLQLVTLQFPDHQAFGFEFNDTLYRNWLIDNANNVDLFTTSSSKEVSFFNNTAMLVAQSPIYTSDDKKQLLGYLIFFKEINDELFNYFERITHFKIKEIPVANHLPNIFLPLTQAQATQSVCLFSLNQTPVQCFELTFTGNERPVFFKPKTIFTYFIGVSIPVFLFAIFIYQIISPLRDALYLLNKNKKEQILRPLPLNRKLYIKEISQLRSAYNHLVVIANRQRLELERLSNTDRLTDISNRRAFDHALLTTWNRLVRHKQSVALIMIDIDHFKNFNDYYGHQIGDMALQKVAKTLASCARRSDEIAARFGGEEFVLIVYLNNQYDLQHFQEHMFEEIRKLKIPHKKSTTAQHLTISAGVAWIKDSGQWLKDFTPEQWLSAADMALYKAKQIGRNCYRTEYIFELSPFDLEVLRQPVAAQEETASTEHTS